MTGRLQRKMLNDYSSKYGSFKVAVNFGDYWQHLTYPSVQAYNFVKMYEDYDDGQGLTDRQIFDDEIVIETDLTFPQLNLSVAQQVCDYLREHAISYSLWYSGNKSFHIHLHFEELQRIQNPFVLKKMKQSFLLWLFNCHNLLGNQEPCGVCDKVKSKTTCLIQKFKVDTQLTGNHLIRLEYSQHVKTNKHKELIAIHNSDTSHIPKDVYNIFNNINNIYYNNILYNNINNINSTPKNCVNNLKTLRLKDGKKRAAFIIYNNEKLTSDNTKAAETLIKWNASLQEPLEPQYIQNLIHQGQQNQQRPGCEYTHQLLNELGRTDLTEACTHGKNQT